MTKEEAKELVRDAFDVWESEYETPSRNDWSKEHEARDMAIEALDREPILDKVKKAREEIADWDVNKVMDGCSEPFKLGVARGLDIASEILDKLIESEE